MDLVPEKKVNKSPTTWYERHRSAVGNASTRQHESADQATFDLGEDGVVERAGDDSWDLVGRRCTMANSFWGWTDGGSSRVECTGRMCSGRRIHVFRSPPRATPESNRLGPNCAGTSNGRSGALPPWFGASGSRSAARGGEQDTQ